MVKNGDPNYTGITDIDANGDALPQLSTIVSDMKNFFTTFMSDCTKTRNDGKTTLQVKNERLDAWEDALKIKEDNYFQ